MSIGLSMVVKNEEKNVKSCLKEIYDLFDEIVVVDTGSTDKTKEILTCEYKVNLINVKSSSIDNYSITEARNISIDRNKSDWILILDADERISREDVSKIRSQLLQGNLQNSGEAYFITWRNTLKNKQFDDYKLALFKNGNGVKFEGIVHPNPQQSLRSRCIDAEYFDGAVIHHSLDKLSLSRGCRKQRLTRCVQNYPEYWRYFWFLGYMYFLENDYENAVPILRDTCNSLSNTFPVECLNAHIVLIDINAKKRNRDKCERIMKQALTFFDSKRNDFEVKANIEMESWLIKTHKFIKLGKFEEVKAYEFAF